MITIITDIIPGGSLVQRAQVVLFLTQFRQCWPPKCTVINNDKNIQALADLNIAANQRRDIILHLSAANYSEGPLKDRDRGGEGIWIFGKQVEGREVYIKLNLFEVSGKFFASCLSFHPAERALKYPFS